jgi:hypothetical protein
MGGYILKRILSAVPVLLGITVIVFLIMAMIPGDPATAILGSYATPENVERLNRHLGLDQPLWRQYFTWLGNLLQGDFGRSFALNRPCSGRNPRPVFRNFDPSRNRFRSVFRFWGSRQASSRRRGNTGWQTRRSPSS